MIIAGLTGDIGHGKTTFANFLATQSSHARHLETWELVSEVASSLKDSSSTHPQAGDIDSINKWLEVLPELVKLHVHADITFEDVKLTGQRLKDHPTHYVKLFEYLHDVDHSPKLAATPITDETKESFRPLLQWVGGFIAINIDGVWYQEIRRRIQHMTTQGVDLVTVGGVRFPRDAEILRNSGGVVLEVVRPGMNARDSGDLTERERTLIEPDSTIINDCSLSGLEQCAQQVWHDLMMRDLRPTYTASTAAVASS